MKAQWSIQIFKKLYNEKLQCQAVTEPSPMSTLIPTLWFIVFLGGPYQSQGGENQMELND